MAYEGAALKPNPTKMPALQRVRTRVVVMRELLFLVTVVIIT